jgi:hypothetical protein
MASKKKKIKQLDNIITSLNRFVTSRKLKKVKAKTFSKNTLNLSGGGVKDGKKLLTDAASNISALKSLVAKKIPYSKAKATAKEETIAKTEVRAKAEAKQIIADEEAKIDAVDPTAKAERVINVLRNKLTDLNEEKTPALAEKKVANSTALQAIISKLEQAKAGLLPYEEPSRGRIASTIYRKPTDDEKEANRKLFNTKLIPVLERELKDIERRKRILDKHETSIENTKASLQLLIDANVTYARIENNYREKDSEFKEQKNIIEKEREATETAKLYSEWDSANNEQRLDPKYDSIRQPIKRLQDLQNQLKELEVQRDREKSARETLQTKYDLDAKIDDSYDKYIKALDKVISTLDELKDYKKKYPSRFDKLGFDSIQKENYDKALAELEVVSIHLDNVTKETTDKDNREYFKLLVDEETKREAADKEERDLQKTSNEYIDNLQFLRIDNYDRTMAETLDKPNVKAATKYTLEAEAEYEKLNLLALRTASTVEGNKTNLFDNALAERVVEASILLKQSMLRTSTTILYAKDKIFKEDNKNNTVTPPELKALLEKWQDMSRLEKLTQDDKFMKDAVLKSYKYRIHKFGSGGSFQDSIALLKKTKDECRKILEAVQSASSYRFTPEQKRETNNDTNSGNPARRPNFIDIPGKEMEIATKAINSQDDKILTDVKNLETELLIQGRTLETKQQDAPNQGLNRLLTSIVWNTRNVIMTTKELCQKLAVWDNDYLGEIDKNTKQKKLTQEDINTANTKRDEAKIKLDNAKKTEEATIWSEMAVDLSKYSIKELLNLEQITKKIIEKEIRTAQDKLDTAEIEHTAAIEALKAWPKDDIDTSKLSPVQIELNTKMKKKEAQDELEAIKKKDALYLKLYDTIKLAITKSFGSLLSVKEKTKLGMSTEMANRIMAALNAVTDADKQVNQSAPLIQQKWIYAKQKAQSVVNLIKEKEGNILGGAPPNDSPPVENTKPDILDDVMIDGILVNKEVYEAVKDTIDFIMKEMLENAVTKNIPIDDIISLDANKEKEILNSANELIEEVKNTVFNENSNLQYAETAYTAKEDFKSKRENDKKDALKNAEDNEKNKHIIEDADVKEMERKVVSLQGELDVVNESMKKGKLEHTIKLDAVTQTASELAVAKKTGVKELIDVAQQKFDTANDEMKKADTSLELQKKNIEEVKRKVAEATKEKDIAIYKAKDPDYKKSKEALNELNKKKIILEKQSNLKPEDKKLQENKIKIDKLLKEAQNEQLEIIKKAKKKAEITVNDSDLKQAKIKQATIEENIAGVKEDIKDTETELEKIEKEYDKSKISDEELEKLNNKSKTERLTEEEKDLIKAAKKIKDLKQKVTAAKEKEKTLNEEAKSAEETKTNIESATISRIEKYGDKPPPPPDKTPSHIIESIEAFILALALTLSEAMPRTESQIKALNERKAKASSEQLTPLEEILKDSAEVIVEDDTEEGEGTGLKSSSLVGSPRESPGESPGESSQETSRQLPRVSPRETRDTTETTGGPDLSKTTGRGRSTIELRVSDVDIDLTKEKTTKIEEVNKIIQEIQELGTMGSAKITEFEQIKKTTNSKKEKKTELMTILNVLLDNKRRLRTIQLENNTEYNNIEARLGFDRTNGGKDERTDEEISVNKARVELYDKMTETIQAHIKIIDTIMTYLKENFDMKYQWIEIVDSKEEIYIGKVGIINKLYKDNIDRKERAREGDWAFKAWIPDKGGLAVLVRPDGIELSKKLKVTNSNNDIIDKFHDLTVWIYDTRFIIGKEYDTMSEYNFEPLIDNANQGSITHLKRGKFMSRLDSVKGAISSRSTSDIVKGSIRGIEKNLVNPLTTRGLREKYKTLIGDILDEKFTRIDYLNLLKTKIRFGNGKQIIRNILITKISYIFSQGQTRLNFFNSDKLRKNFKKDEKVEEEGDAEQYGGGGYGARDFDKDDAYEFITFILDSLLEFNKMKGITDGTKLLLLSTYLKTLFSKMGPSELNKLLPIIDNIKIVSRSIITHFLTRLNQSSPDEAGKISSSEGEGNGNAAKVISQLNFGLKHNVKSFIEAIVDITLHTHELEGTENKIANYLDRKYDIAMKKPVGDEKLRVENLELNKVLKEIFGNTTDSIKDYRKKIKEIDDIVDSITSKNIGTKVKQVKEVIGIINITSDDIRCKLPRQIKTALANVEKEGEAFKKEETSLKQRLLETESLLKQIIQTIKPSTETQAQFDEFKRRVEAPGSSSPA